MPFSCAFYCCGNIQLKSLKLFPVEKNDHFLNPTQNKHFGTHERVCAHVKQQSSTAATRLDGGERERDAARLSERSRGELSGETSGALSCFPWLWGRSCCRTLKVRKGVDIWVHKPKLERKDGKPVCVPRAHRQRRGGATAGPGRQGWMLPGPQQWFGAGRLLPVCAVSLNPERVTHFLTLEL